MKRQGFVCLLLLALTGVASAQLAVSIRPEDPFRGGWSIQERNVEIIVRDQVASTTITETLINNGSRVIEAEYMLPIPPEAAVDQMTLMVDGKEISAQVMNAEEARNVYNEIVRRKRDPALLEYAGYGLLKSSAFPLQPNQPANIVVHYDYLCRRDGNLTEISYPMSTGKYSAKPIEKLKVFVDVKSDADITTVYSPTVKANVERNGSTRAEVTYKAENLLPADDFVVYVGTDQQDVGASMLTYWPERGEDGYYMMLVSPNPRTASSNIAEKDLMLVLDRSGSMSGEKIQQAREAARFVVNNLNPGDRFNLITYNDQAEMVFETMREASQYNVEIALSSIDRINAAGGTNIHQALELAMDQCAEAQKSASNFVSAIRPAIVMFLTDGLPTAGNTSEADILSNTRTRNKTQARVFAFGVGYDVNVRLLNNLVDENHGRSSYVTPVENIETKVSSLYNKIRNPVMTDVTARIEGFRSRDNTPSSPGDLFEGDQLVQVGRLYTDSDSPFHGVKSMRSATTLKLKGTYAGETREFEFPVEVNYRGESSPYRYLERLWAVKRVSFLIDEIQLRGKSTELVDEVIRLGKKYGIVTPYTSFLADENRNLSDNGVLEKEAVIQLEEMAITYEHPSAQLHVRHSERAKAMSIRESQADEQAAQSRNPGFEVDMLGFASAEALESGIAEEINTIRAAGNLTIFKKGVVWKGSDVLDIDLERDAAQIKTVQRFTPEYDSLVKANTLEENQLLSTQQEGEKFLMKLRGQIYLIE